MPQKNARLGYILQISLNDSSRCWKMLMLKKCWDGVYFIVVWWFY